MENEIPSINIIKSMTLNKNIAKLRYFNIYERNNNFDIKIDVTNEFP